MVYRSRLAPARSGAELNGQVADSAGASVERSLPVRIHRFAIRAGFLIVHRNSLVGRRYRELERSQWQPREMVLDDQWRKLQQLVRYAYDRVPFYRRRMDEAGLPPNRIVCPDDYRRLPVLTRDDLRANKEELVAAGYPRSKLIPNGSGGSTGEPVPFYHDPTLVAGSQAAKLRNFGWAGWEPGDAWARLWGSNFDVAPHQQLRGRILERLTRVRWLSCFEMTDASMERYARLLAAFHPDVLEAYVNPLYLLCRFLRARGLVGSIRPRGAIVSAETLYDYHRSEIEAVLGCKVFNRYGCREVGDAAHECPSGRMHLNVETVYTEFMVDGRPAAPGASGEIILTPLDLYGMPMLRYRVDDIGSPAEGSCRCGRSLPLMDRVQGRIQDLVVTPSGQHLTGVFFAHLLKELEVKRFQVVQETIGGLDFYIIPGAGFGSSQVDYVRRKFHEYTHGELELRLHLTDNIPLTRSGKHRVTLSRVRGPYAPRAEEWHDR
jgi:phenylacetate-CoA ligase